MRSSFRTSLVLTMALIGSLTGLIGAVGTTYLLKKIAPTPHVVMVDVKTLISQKAAHLSQSQKSEKDLEKEVGHFAQHLPESIRSWSKHHHFVVLKPEVCLSGVPNMTADLAQWMDKIQPQIEGAKK